MIARDADLLRLRERRPEHHRPFDSRLVMEASLSDLRLGGPRAQWEESRELDGDPETFPRLDAWLTQRQIGASLDGEWHPTVAGLLVYGSSVQDFFPGAMVEFVRYAGEHIDSDVVERKTMQSLDMSRGWVAGSAGSASCWIEMAIPHCTSKPPGLHGSL